MTDFTPQNITSRANPRIVSAAKLQEKKHRTAEKRFFFEGHKLFSEARAARIPIRCVIAEEQAFAKYRALFEDPDFEILIVPQSVYEKITAEHAPQGIFCIADFLENLKFSHTLSTPPSQFGSIMKAERYEKLLICDGLRDPGNLGTVIRSASAFGVDTLLLSADCADIYNPKTLRGAMGAIFSREILFCADLPAALARFSCEGRRVLAAILDTEAVSVEKAALTEKDIVLIGNEGHGLSRAAVEASDLSVILPINTGRGVESLNAATAASVFMWEQRRVSAK